MAEIVLDGIVYLTDNEVIKSLGISSATFYEWIKVNRINPPNRFNHRGWRLWNPEEIEKVKSFKNKTFKYSELQ